MHTGDSHWKSWRAISVLVLWMLPMVAPAQSRDTAQQHIDKARQLYDELEYERALEELDRAQRRARTQDDTVSILLHEGVILSELGREEEASAAFQAAFSMRPNASLPLLVSPKIKRLFEAALVEAKRELAPAPVELGARPSQVKPEPRTKAAQPPSAPAPAPVKPSSPPPAPVAEPKREVSAPPVASPAPPQAASRRLIDRNELLKRIAEAEVRLRQESGPELPASALVRLKEIRQQVLSAATAEHRKNAAVKLDRWESRFLLPLPEPPAPAVSPQPAPKVAEPPPPEAPKPSPVDPRQSIDRGDLLKRIAEAEAKLRQKSASGDMGHALVQLKEIRRQVASAATVEHRRNAAVKLERWEQRFLSTP